jgi:hypothetical protein
MPRISETLCTATPRKLIDIKDEYAFSTLTADALSVCEMSVSVY